MRGAASGSVKEVDMSEYDELMELEPRISAKYGTGAGNFFESLVAGWSFGDEFKEYVEGIIERE